MQQPQLAKLLVLDIRAIYHLKRSYDRVSFFRLGSIARGLLLATVSHLKNASRQCTAENVS
jgi:hypothetical protein